VTFDEANFKKMADAFVDGDTATAQAAFTEMVKGAAQAAAKAAAAKAYETARDESEGAYRARVLVQEAQEAADLVQAEYDIFNDKTESFDEALFEKALTLRDALMSTGMSVGEAIIEAAQVVATQNGVTGNSTKTQSSEPAKKPAVKAPNIERKLEQAAKSPQKLGGEPNASTPELNIMEMSDEEFEKLTPAELARLRGDII
jgi:hypothetical protein